MDTAGNQKKVRAFVVENLLLGEEENDFSDSQSFLESGLIDSTGILEVIAFLEEEYEITIADEEMVPDNLDSVDNIVAFLQTRRVG
ncbi:MAG: acyl carrier protein [Myxococcota bacterium]|nr:acyl carrier protein [Spirochaeta sp.]RPG09305.1 MAG: acyl carrier protein [Proteobacteria bacterium TMED72]